MEESSRAIGVAAMRVLITLALWAAVSIPLALLVGRALRSGTAGIAEEAERYLRSRAPRPFRLARSGALVAATALAVGVLLWSDEAVSQLPAARLAAGRALDRLLEESPTETASPRPSDAATADDRAPAPRRRASVRGTADREAAVPAAVGAPAAVDPDVASDGPDAPGAPDDRLDRVGEERAAPVRQDRERAAQRDAAHDETDVRARRPAPPDITPPSAATTTTQPPARSGTAPPTADDDEGAPDT